jgi:hypothetical protein
MSIFLISLIFISMNAWSEQNNSFRPPAIPLVTHDPYFSIWSMTDCLSDDWTRHWTGKPQALMAMVRIDDKAYRLMGREPRWVPAMNQTGFEVFPTKTLYRFIEAGVELTMTFLSPLLVNDLEILSRPVTYLIVSVRSTDNQPHKIVFYFDACSEIAVNEPQQRIVWSRLNLDSLQVLSFGSQQQPVLEKAGDDLRIDWGYFYLAVPRKDGTATCLSGYQKSREGFIQNGQLPSSDDLRFPRPVEDGYPVAAAALDLGTVGEKSVSRFLMLAYDDQFSIEYFYQKIRPLWRSKDWEATELLEAAARDYEVLTQRCRIFDEGLFI